MKIITGFLDHIYGFNLLNVYSVQVLVTLCTKDFAEDKTEDSFANFFSENEIENYSNEKIIDYELGKNNIELE